jgi:DNA-binding Lrp family transcriptional regulator
MKAYVLMHVRPGSVLEVVRNLRRVSGILEANMTFGPYDAVAVVEARDVNHLGTLVASGIQPIPGILDTMTCLVVEPA